MPQYMLLIHNGDWEELSPEQMQQTIQRYIAWVRTLREQHRFIAGDELKNTGRTLVVKNGQIVDGPFTETKEIIGGYFIIEAADYDEAVAVTRDCPTFAHGGSVQVREINNPG
ncbi:MAG: YciI family protein [candidate division Zixibacteria bacterium]|nr:YciI family protein [candidate division Zixibacteria bacterium]